jgi:hypothetical protein
MNTQASYQKQGGEQVRDIIDTHQGDLAGGLDLHREHPFLASWGARSPIPTAMWCGIWTPPSRVPFDIVALEGYLFQFSLPGNIPQEGAIDFSSSCSSGLWARLKEHVHQAYHKDDHYKVKPGFLAILPNNCPTRRSKEQVLLEKGLVPFLRV